MIIHDFVRIYFIFTNFKILLHKKWLCINVYLWLFMTFFYSIFLCMIFYNHDPYYNVWLQVTLNYHLFLCVTMFDYVRLNRALYDSAWPCITLQDPLWLWVRLTVLDTIGLYSTLTCMVWLFSYCINRFNCLNLLKTFNSVWICLSHSYMKKICAC